MRTLKQIAGDPVPTNAQRAQIKPILRDQVQQAQAVRGDVTLAPAQKQAQIKGIRQAHRRQIMTLLTPAQKAQLAQLRRQRQNG